MLFLRIMVTSTARKKRNPKAKYWNPQGNMENSRRMKRVFSVSRSFSIFLKAKKLFVTSFPSSLHRTLLHKLQLKLTETELLILLYFFSYIFSSQIMYLLILSFTCKQFRHSITEFRHIKLLSTCLNKSWAPGCLRD